MNMPYPIILRISLYIVIFLSIIAGWWLVAVPLLIFGAWQLSFRVELIIAGLMYDSLFGMIPGTGVWGYIGTIVSLAILLVFITLKRILR
jgi:hypothetical protein